MFYIFCPPVLAFEDAFYVHLWLVNFPDKHCICRHKRKIRHTSFEIYRISENCPLEWRSKDLDFFGTPWRIRTVDTKRRRLVLYPAELMVHSLLWWYYITNSAWLQVVPRKKIIHRQFFIFIFRQREIELTVLVSNDSNQIFCQLVILSGVELSPSEERGESAKRKAVCGIS